MFAVHDKHQAKWMATKEPIPVCRVLLAEPAIAAIRRLNRAVLMTGGK